MIDAADKMTAQLDGLEPLPPIPLEQRPQAERLALMHYTGPRDAARPMCGNCQHASLIHVWPDSPAKAIRHRCSKGGFPVQRGGLCMQFSAPTTP